jgi:hypothetical protein
MRTPSSIAMGSTRIWILTRLLLLSIWALLVSECSSHFIPGSMVVDPQHKAQYRSTEADPRSEHDKHQSIISTDVIKVVLANVATVKEGSAWWTLNWIRVQCDDPEGSCPKPPEDPCPPPSLQSDEQTMVTLAYARNPDKTTDGYPDISFCPGFFQLRNLKNAMAFGSGPRHRILKSDLARYQGRGK